MYVSSRRALEVPEALARFAGAWIGVWVDQKGREALCHTLVIEEVLPNGYARIIYSIGTMRRGTSVSRISGASPAGSLTVCSVFICRCRPARV